jgi:sulfur relay (sulfurtransferase) DsrC/TusE family protein
VNAQNLAPTERPCGGSDWTPEAAAAVAVRLGILLTPPHWQVLACAREECLRTRRLPDVATLAMRTGIDRDGIERLFPGDAWLVIAELAGMAHPEGARGPAT